MEWTPEAEEALKKVPFFVRKRVRARVEKEAQETGSPGVTLAAVQAAQASYLAGMSAEVMGYQLETCFGPSGCTNRAALSEGLHQRVAELLKREDLLGFLKTQVKGPLKFHHEFRVSLADCPNACSQPQIRDVGIIAACVPELSDAECTGCAACIEGCAESAIAMEPVRGRPHTDLATCLNCGQCIPACPTGAIAAAWRGYRVQLGGRLGRHPRLARELPGIFSEDQVIEILQECLRIYKERSRGGERFAHLFQEEDFQRLSRRFCGGGL